jgi:hypothetical protein
VYDQSNPQSVLLTVQASPNDRWLNPRHRAGLVTAWLGEVLGPDAALPHAGSLRLSAPAGLAPEVVDVVARYIETHGRDGSRAPTDVPKLACAGPDNGPALSIGELQQLGAQSTDKETTAGGRNG